MQKFNLIEIGKMLNMAFSTDELNSLAFMMDMDLHDEVANLTKSQKLIAIISFCARQGRLDEILLYTKDKNPSRYEEYLSVLVIEGSDSAITTLQFPGSSLQDTSNKEIKELVSNLRNVVSELVSEGREAHIKVNAIEALNLGGNMTGQNKTSSGIRIGGSNSGTVIQGDGNQVNSNNREQNIDFGDNASISGTFNAVLAETVQNSFNTVADSNALDQVKVTLNKLLSEVSKLGKQLNGQNDKELRQIVKQSDRMVEDISEDDLSDDDAKDYLEKLKTAAAIIGELAQPVVVAALKVISAVGMVL
ncbi:MAG: hypothetical protein ACI85U_000983 [Candidatus Promineifilaceae bacterium]|jgi:hypothetical protein